MKKMEAQIEAEQAQRMKPARVNRAKTLIYYGKLPPSSPPPESSPPPDLAPPQYYRQMFKRAYAFDNASHGCSNSGSDE